MPKTLKHLKYFKMSSFEDETSPSYSSCQDLSNVVLHVQTTSHLNHALWIFNGQKSIC
jgi:hypothetical protein